MGPHTACDTLLKCEYAHLSTANGKIHFFPVQLLGIVANCLRVYAILQQYFCAVWHIQRDHGNMCTL